MQADRTDLESVMTNILEKVASDKVEVLSRNVSLLLCASVPSFMINLDSNIVAVSLRSISRSFGADFTAIEWVIGAYTLTFASLVLPAGSLADRYGRKHMLIAGLAIFSLASFFCGVAPNVLVLDVARAFQGVGAALQLSSSLAILSHGFHGAARGRAFAFWGTMTGIAIAAGPVAGGLITQHFGWERAFYVNPIIGVAMIALTLTSVVESKDPNATRIDLSGLITFSSFLFLITLALIRGNHKGWDSAEVQSEFAASAALFMTFIFVELRQELPMLDLSFFRNPTFIGANLAGLSFGACLLTMLTYLPIYFQGGLGYGAQAAGLLMLPLAIPMIVVPRVVSVRFSGRTLLTAGLAILSGGLLLMALAAPHFHYVDMLGGMMLCGIGGGVLNSAVVEVGITAIPPAQAGMASGMSGTIRFSGLVIGFAALGAILVSRISSIAAGDPASGRLSDAADFVRNVAAGNLAGTSNVRSGLGELRELSFRSFGGGYQTILFVAAAFALVVAILCWILVSPADTTVVKPTRKRE
jgi:EmrB/QacA subfamily drug resistance transporter